MGLLTKKPEAAAPGKIAEEPEVRRSGEPDLKSGTPTRSQALALLATLMTGGEIDDRVREGKVVSGEKLTKPDDMDYGDAIEIFRRRQKEEETEIQIAEKIDAFPADGARALSLAIEEIFGVAFQQTSWSFFGPSLPQRITVKTPKGEYVVPWGDMTLPGMKNTLLTTRLNRATDGSIVMEIVCKTLRKHERKIRKMIDRTHELIKTASFYRGQALKVDFSRMDQVGYSPEFMDLQSRVGSVLILNDVTEEMSTGSVLTPISRTAVCREMSVPLRRGILLEGPFGTGKTLSAQKVARECVKNGWTFIYAQSSKDLPAARKLATRYQPAVVFAEDLDHVLNEDEETIETVRNALDAIDGKDHEIIILCTTNRLEALKLARGMLRPGRFDALIHVGYPDGKSAEALLRHYANGLLAKDEPLNTVSDMLAGSSAAMIRECVERAKLWSIAHGTEGTLREKDLVSAAKELKAHIDVMADKTAPPPSKHEQLGKLLTEVVTEGSGTAFREFEENVNNQLEHFHDHLRNPGGVKG